MAGSASLLSGGSDFTPARRGASEEDDIDITPMIDIVFLLLIFFIVAAKIDEQSGVNLPAAQYGTMVSMSNAVVVTVEAGPDGSGVIYKGPAIDDATKINVSDLEEQEQQIANYVESRMNEAPTPQAIVVQAAAKLKHREVARVLKAIARAETDIEQLHLAVLEEG